MNYYGEEVKCNGIQITLEDGCGHVLYSEWAHCTGSKEAEKLARAYQDYIGRYDLELHWRWIIF